MGQISLGDKTARGLFGILRRAYGTELQVAAGTTDAGIRIALTDNGRGAYAVPPQDLRSMHEHAALGAVLDVSTTSAGACLQLVLPLTR